jgi:hypothetical protein
VKTVQAVMMPASLLHLLSEMQLPFHQEARSKIFSNARALRKEMTVAEKALWEIL